MPINKNVIQSLELSFTPVSNNGHGLYYAIISSLKDQDDVFSLRKLVAKHLEDSFDEYAKVATLPEKQTIMELIGEGNGTVGSIEPLILSKVLSRPVIVLEVNAENLEINPEKIIKECPLNAEILQLGYTKDPILIGKDSAGNYYAVNSLKDAHTHKTILYALLEGEDFSFGQTTETTIAEGGSIEQEETKTTSSKSVFEQFDEFLADGDLAGAKEWCERLSEDNKHLHNLLLAKISILEQDYDQAKRLYITNKIQKEHPTNVFLSNIGLIKVLLNEIKKLNAELEKGDLETESSLLDISNKIQRMIDTVGRTIKECITLHKTIQKEDPSWEANFKYLCEYETFEEFKQSAEATLNSYQISLAIWYANNNNKIAQIEQEKRKQKQKELEKEAEAKRQKMQEAFLETVELTQELQEAAASLLQSQSKFVQKKQEVHNKRQQLKKIKKKEQKTTHKHQETQQLLQKTDNALQELEKKKQSFEKKHQEIQQTKQELTKDKQKLEQKLNELGLNIEQKKQQIKQLELQEALPKQQLEFEKKDKSIFKEINSDASSNSPTSSSEKEEQEQHKDKLPPQSSSSCSSSTLLLKGSTLSKKPQPILPKLLSLDELPSSSKELVLGIAARLEIEQKKLNQPGGRYNPYKYSIKEGNINNAILTLKQKNLTDIPYLPVWFNGLKLLITFIIIQKSTTSITKLLAENWDSILKFLQAINKYPASFALYKEEIIDLLEQLSKLNIDINASSSPELDNLIENVIEHFNIQNMPYHLSRKLLSSLIKLKPTNPRQKKYIEEHCITLLDSLDESKTNMTNKIDLLFLLAKCDASQQGFLKHLSEERLKKINALIQQSFAYIKDNIPNIDEARLRDLRFLNKAYTTWVYFQRKLNKQKPFSLKDFAYLKKYLQEKLRMQTTRSFFQKDVINFIRNSLKSFDYEVHDVKEEFPIKNTIVDGKFFITDIRTRQPFTVIIEADGPEHHMFSCRPATLTKALTFSPTSKTSRTRLRDEIMQSKTSSSDPRKPMYYVTIDLHEWQNAPTKQLRMSLLKEKLTALP